MKYEDFFTPVDAPVKAAKRGKSAFDQFADNIKAQLEIFLGKKPLNARGKFIEKTWRDVDDKTIQLELRYANEPLVISGGKTTQHVARDKFKDALTFLIERTNAGDFDDEINRVRKARKWDLAKREAE